MSSPLPEFTESDLDDLDDFNEFNDFDLNDAGCTLDIVNEIDKFLEGFTSDAEFPPVNDEQLDDYNVIDEINTPNLEEQKFTKVEPNIEMVNDYFAADSEDNMETLSFNFDDYKEKSVFGQQSSEASSTDASTGQITYTDKEIVKFSFLKSDNIKDSFCIPEVKSWEPYKGLKHFNSIRTTSGKDQLKNNNYKNTFKKPNPWNEDSAPRNNVFQQKLTNKHQEKTDFAHSSTQCTSNINELKDVQYEKNNSQCFPKYIEKPTCNIPRQSYLPHVPFFKSRCIVEYLNPVSLVGKTIQFLSRKLANTSMREQIIIELANHGTLENNWWTPDDMLYVTFAERSISHHVFRMYLK